VEAATVFQFLGKIEGSLQVQLLGSNIMALLTILLTIINKSHSAKELKNS